MRDRGVLLLLLLVVLGMRRRTGTPTYVQPGEWPEGEDNLGTQPNPVPPRPPPPERSNTP